MKRRLEDADDGDHASVVSKRSRLDIAQAITLVVLPIDAWNHHILPHLSLVDIYFLSLVSKEQRLIIKAVIASSYGYKTTCTLTDYIIRVNWEWRRHENVQWGIALLTDCRLERLDELASPLIEFAGRWLGKRSGKYLGPALRACETDDAACRIIDRLKQYWFKFSMLKQAVLRSGRVGLCTRISPIWKERLDSVDVLKAIKSDSMDMVDAIVDVVGEYWDKDMLAAIALRTSDQMSTRFLPHPRLATISQSVVDHCFRKKRALDRLARYYADDEESMRRIKRAMPMYLFDDNRLV